LTLSNDLRIRKVNRRKIIYAIHVMQPAHTHTRSKARWKLALLLPYLALCFPALYARTNPTLFGFPFFYWYQLAWVLIASGLMFVVYKKLKI